MPENVFSLDSTWVPLADFIGVPRNRPLLVFVESGEVALYSGPAAPSDNQYDIRAKRDQQITVGGRDNIAYGRSYSSGFVRGSVRIQIDGPGATRKLSNPFASDGAPPVGVFQTTPGPQEERQQREVVAVGRTAAEFELLNELLGQARDTNTYLRAILGLEEPL